MLDLLTYAIFASTMFYLGSRATVTRWLWSRYPKRFAEFMDCPACAGFWYGWFLALTIGRDQHLMLFGRVFDCGTYFGYDKALVVGFAMIVLVPIVSGLMHMGLSWVGSATAVWEAPSTDPDPWGVDAESRQSERDLP
jgi:hypothetical protein